MCFHGRAAARSCASRETLPYGLVSSWRIRTTYLGTGSPPLSLSPKVDENSPRQEFIAVRVSRDGRDLVVLSKKRRVLFIQDFERICRGDTTIERAALVLNIRPEDTCSCLDFEHGRVCGNPSRALYFHLRPRSFSEGCVRATLQRTLRRPRRLLG